jgi:hypothetical protein
MDDDDDNYKGTDNPSFRCDMEPMMFFEHRNSEI